MATEVSLFSGNAVAEPSQAVDALRKLAMAAQQGSGGKAFMKLDKGSGKFIWGADSVEVDESELWAVNPASFMIGKIGWKDGQVVGEHMFPITSGQTIDESELTPIESAKDGDGWRDQLTFELKHIADEVEVVFKTTSYGGKNAIAALAGEIGEHTAQNPALPIAVVKLKSDWYKHKKYGRIYNPTFEVVDWLGPDGTKPKPSKPKPKPLV